MGDLTFRLDKDVFSCLKFESTLDCEKQALDMEKELNNESVNLYRNFLKNIIRNIDLFGDY